jgi:hypothetical protein
MLKYGEVVKSNQVVDLTKEKEEEVKKEEKEVKKETKVQ